MKTSFWAPAAHSLVLSPQVLAAALCPHFKVAYGEPLVFCSSARLATSPFLIVSRQGGPAAPRALTNADDPSCALWPRRGRA